MSDNPFRRGQVLDSQEFRRILALPRLSMTEAEALQLAQELTQTLKTAKGTMTLRPIQARALHAIGVYGGLFGPMRVGAGKTLTSLLASYVHDAKRPILILPAHLVEKTKVEMRELERHWIMPRNLRMISYQMLGREGSAKLLEQYKPDMIIVDECFVAGTLIRTPSGDRTIESLSVGDEVVSYRNGLFEVANVTDAWSSFSEEIYRVRIDGRQYTCTGGHPFLTARGWIPARDLIVGDAAVSHVRGPIQLPTLSEEALLQCELCETVSALRCSGFGANASSNVERGGGGGVCPYEEEKPHEGPQNSRCREQKSQTDGAQATCARRQWETRHGCPEATIGSAWGGLETGASISLGGVCHTGVSGRSSSHRNENHRGGGRGISPKLEGSGEGREKNSVPGGEGLARVEGVERVDLARTRSSCRVYNLHIAGPETYVLGGGEVVHNCQKIKNRKAAVTRRVARYMTDHPETRFVAISGTIMKDSIKDFAHVLTWCLKEGAPVPAKASEVEEWADCLDEKLQNPFKRLAPGPLLRLATKEDWDEVEDRDEIRIARRGFRRRLIDTPGVVATQNEQVDCKLRITALEYEVDDVTNANFDKLRKTWTTPDDWQLMMAAEAWRVSRELAMGFHYVQVDKEKYGLWVTNQKKLKPSRPGNTGLETSRPSEPTTARELRNARAPEQPRSKELELSLAGTGSQKNNIKDFCPRGVEAATSADASQKPKDSLLTTATQQAAYGESFAPLATSLSESLETLGQASNESLHTFLAQARPPQEWLLARKEWAAYVREALSRSRTLDTELQVRKSVQNGERRDGTEILAKWQQIEPNCTIYTFAVWHDDSALDVCAEWMKKGPGIVWTEHSFFAYELAKRTGARYFGQEGKDQKGIPIELADPRMGPIIASVPANGTGRNLQAWSRNLITSCPTCPAMCEQLLGRTHRDGQKEGLVEVDVLLGCKEHFTAWQSALAGAQAALETTGLSQKLLVCDVVGFPDEDEILARPEARWGNVSKTLT